MVASVGQLRLINGAQAAESFAGCILGGGADNMAGGGDGEARVVGTVADIDRNHTSEGILTAILYQFVAGFCDDAHSVSAAC